MGDEAKIFTLSEVSEHNQAHDCWIVINGKVLSSFSSFSPLKLEISCFKISPFVSLHEIKLLKSEIMRSNLLMRREWKMV